MNLEAFRNLQLPCGFCLTGIEVVEACMLDAIGRPAVAKAVIENHAITIYLADKQVPGESSTSIYHEVLEALTVGVPDPPLAVCDLNEAGFEEAAREAHQRFGLANPDRVLKFLQEFGFYE